MIQVQDKQGAEALEVTQLIDRWYGFGTINGGAATAGANPFDISLDAVTVLVDGTEHSVGSSVINLAEDVSPDNPRKVVIYVDNNGALNKLIGTAEPAKPEGEVRFDTYRPAPPDLYEPTETGGQERVLGTPLCEVWLGQNDERVTDADIRDRRFPSILVADAGEFASLVVNSFTDPAGVTHTAELADATDVKSDADVEAVINNDLDHGSTAPHNYRTDAEIRTAVEGNVDAAALNSTSATADQFLRANADDTSEWAEIPALEAPMLDSGIVTHTGGGSTTVEVTGVSADQTETFDYSIGVDTAVLADYAFNTEMSREWDNTNGRWDVTFTFTWDTDPGTGTDVTLFYVIYNSHPAVVSGRYTDNDAIAAMSGADISPAIVDISQALELPIYDNLANHPGATEGDLAVATGVGTDAAGLYLYDAGAATWDGPFITGSSLQLSNITIDGHKDWQGFSIQNLAAPANPADAARKQEVDDVSSSLTTHEGTVDAHHTRFTLDEVRQLLVSIHSWNESGTIANGKAGNIISTDVAAGETLAVYRVGIMQSDGSALPTGMSLRIVTPNGDGTYTDRGAIVSGDGTSKNDLTGFNPAFATWDNTTGSTQSAILVADNGQFGAGTGTEQAYESEGVFEVL